MKFKNLIEKAVATYMDDVIAWRRHIHQHPEVSGQEKETSTYIQGVLDSL